MCGIAGAVGSVTPRVVEAVAAAGARMAHRGPDADGLWTHGVPSARGVAFAHRRLAIIDLSADGVQPMLDPQSGCAIVFNGEIYNFRELRAELEAGGERFRSRSDTEVLLRAWIRWGEACVRRLRGMFAFAIFDPGRACVFLARDRLGIKPLYLARVPQPGGGECVYFASELRALLATGELAPRLDPQGLATFLWNGFVFGPRTIVQGIERLAPGTHVTLGLDGTLKGQARYWEPPRARSDPDAVERLRAELERAVELRLVSDVPLGIFLSGGIDSSAVTALAVRAARGSVRTFTVSFDESEYDESGSARAVAKQLGTEHAELRLSQEIFRAELDAALDCLDQPSFDAINTYFVSRAVREAGVTVALAGTGGDELFGGYASFADLPRLQLASRLAAPFPASLVRGLARGVARARMGPAGAVPPQTRWAKLADALSLRGSLLELYQLSYAMFLPEFLGELRSRALVDARHGLPLARAAEFAARIRGEPALHAISLLELASFVGERLLPDTDAASMAVALEARVPLLDHVVVEAAAAVPEARRFTPLGRKALLRELALGGLDPAIFERPKSGFQLPLGLWCRNLLGPEIEATLSDRAACQAAGLDPDAVSRLWSAFRAGAPGIFWSRIWSLFVLLRWCRRNGAAL
jgi:asparagine synthase (glutamine-hydrolysing)